MTLHILAKDTWDIVLAECLLPCQGSQRPPLEKDACKLPLGLHLIHRNIFQVISEWASSSAVVKKLGFPCRRLPQPVRLSLTLLILGWWSKIQLNNLSLRDAGAQNVRKKLKTAFDVWPPALVSENYVAFFSRNTKICSEIFWIRSTPLTEIFSREKSTQKSSVKDNYVFLSFLWKAHFQLFEIWPRPNFRQRPSEDKIFWPPFQPFQLPVKRETVKRRKRNVKHRAKHCDTHFQQLKRDYLWFFLWVDNYPC